MTTFRKLSSTAALEADILALIDIAPRFGYAYEQTGLPPLRQREQGFTALYQMMVSQQLSVAAANSIWNKLVSANLTSEKTVLAADDSVLRSNGLSKQKVRYVKSLAEQQIDYQGLSTQTDTQVIKTLTAVTGIGEWTAEIYLLFSLARTDVFAAKDLALQESAKMLYELDERPSDKALKLMAESWAPYRSSAARLLWAYYRVGKGREGV